MNHGSPLGGVHLCKVPLEALGGEGLPSNPQREGLQGPVERSNPSKEYVHGQP